MQEKKNGNLLLALAHHISVILATLLDYVLVPRVLLSSGNLGRVEAQGSWRTVVLCALLTVHGPPGG